jgi:hypothetical protein
MNIGRNDPCPCNSGKKYKKCCLLKLDQLKVDSIILRQERQKLYDAEWETWFAKDQSVGQKNMAEATVNPPFAKGSDGEKLYNEMMNDDLTTSV